MSLGVVLVGCSLEMLQCAGEITVYHNDRAMSGLYLTGDNVIICRETELTWLVVCRSVSSVVE